MGFFFMACKLFVAKEVKWSWLWLAVQLSSKEFLYSPPTNKSNHSLKWGVLCQNSAVVLVRMKHLQRESCSDETSFWVLLLLHELPQNQRDQTDSFHFAAGSLLPLLSFPAEVSCTGWRIFLLLSLNMRNLVSAGYCLLHKFKIQT